MRGSGWHHSDETKKKIGAANSIALKGKKSSAETKKKMSDAKLGKRPTLEARKRMSDARKGWVYSLETRQKIRDTLRKKYPKSPRRFKRYPAEFSDELKADIRNRDGHVCFLCGVKELLVVHHIDYCKSNCDTENLITLCGSCHGKTNRQRGYWAYYFVSAIPDENFTTPGL